MSCPAPVHRAASPTCVFRSSTVSRQLPSDELAILISRWVSRRHHWSAASASLRQQGAEPVALPAVPMVVPIASHCNADPGRGKEVRLPPGCVGHIERRIELPGDTNGSGRTRRRTSLSAARGCLLRSGEDSNVVEQTEGDGCFNSRNGRGTPEARRVCKTRRRKATHSGVEPRAGGVEGDMSDLHSNLDRNYIPLSTTRHGRHCFARRDSQSEDTGW